jgi:hypothetical protein
MFTGELKHQPAVEIECGQAVDEQWIVLVAGLPNNWPQNSM